MFLYRSLIKIWKRVGLRKEHSEYLHWSHELQKNGHLQNLPDGKGFIEHVDISIDVVSGELLFTPTYTAPFQSPLKYLNQCVA